MSEQNIALKFFQRFEDNDFWKIVDRLEVGETYQGRLLYGNSWYIITKVSADSVNFTVDDGMPTVISI